MNYRKRRANAWAGLYVGLVCDAARTDGVSASDGSSDVQSDGGTDDRDESPRTEDGS